MWDKTRENHEKWLNASNDRYDICTYRMKLIPDNVLGIHSIIKKLRNVFNISRDVYSIPD